MITTRGGVSAVNAGSRADTGSRLADGPVGRAGGVVVFDEVPGASFAARLYAEAASLYPGADRQVADVVDTSVGRGGVPPRALCTTGGGPLQDAFYGSEWLHAFLSEQCGTTVVPTGERGSYSFYVAEGDYLGLHLDIDSCDVTLITVLRDDTDPTDAAGGLLVHLDDFGATLDDVRAHPYVGAAVVKAQAGHSMVLLGGLLPHETVPIGGAGQRVISALCFRAV